MSISSLYPSIRPSLLLDFSNTKQLDPRITFSRPTTATYYDGKTVVKAEENLLDYSQQINVWGASYVTYTANSTTAPDGTSTATTVTENTATNVLHYSRNNKTVVSGLQYTLSIYAKPNGRNWIALTWQSGPGYYFNISTGVVGSAFTGTGTAANPVITSVGNGWYRCSLTITAASTTGGIDVFLASADGTASYTGDGTSGVYLWGAQLEQRSTVTAYTPTTTAPITNYIPALQTAVSNDARFDHDPVTGESKGLLIEEQRTNLLTYSADFSNAAWTKSNATITADTVVAPDGTLTGDKVVESAGNNFHYILQNIAYNNQTLTVFAKAAERSQLWVIFNGNASGVFNLLNGTTISISGATGLTSTSITYVGNGWYRCSAYYTGSGTGIGFGTSKDALTYQGDGYSGLYIWGAQLEAGSFLTSYIPTVASQVTRSADSASMTGSNFSSWYRADEGTLYAEAMPMSVANTDFTTVSINDSTANNRFVLGSYGTSPYESIVSSGTFYANINSNYNSLSVGTSYKAAGVSRLNDFAISAQGTAVATDTSGYVPISPTQLEVGKSINTRYLNGTIKRIAYYPKRLSNTELQSLTS